MRTHILDRTFTILLLALGLFVTVRSWQYGLYEGGVPGPGFFPAISGLMMAGLALAVLLRDLAGKGRVGGEIALPVIAAILGSTAALIAYVYAAPLIGMGVAAFALMMIIGALTEEEGRRGRRFYFRLVLAAIGTVILCHLLFAQLIGVPIESPFGF